MYLEKSIKDYLKLISTESPYPGSGSSLALSGAIAASLILMYFKMTQDLLKQEEKLELNKFFSEVKKLRNELMEAVEQEPALCKKFSKPKETAIKEAALIPLLVAQKCNKLLEVILTVDQKIKLKEKNLQSKYEPELLAGVYNAYVGLVGTLVCVKTNLKDLEEGELKKYLMEERERLLEVGKSNIKEILSRTKEQG